MEYGQTDTEAGVDLSPVGTLELLFDPYFYVGLSVSEMSADSESGVVLAFGIATGRACPLEPPGIGRDLGRSGAVLGFP